MVGFRLAAGVPTCSPMRTLSPLNTSCASLPSSVRAPRESTYSRRADGSVSSASSHFMRRKASCTARHHFTASSTVKKATMKASPSVFTSYPRKRASSVRRVRSCSSSAACMPVGHASHRLVDDSMSVNTMVTGSVGASSTESPTGDSPLTRSE